MEADKPTVITFNRDGGGLVILPWEEIGIISTLVTNTGTAEEPIMFVDEKKSLIYVKSISANVIVLHPAQEIVCWIQEVEYVAPEEKP